MEHFDQERLPEDLDTVGRRLRAGRRKATALELDQIKQRATAGAARGTGRKGSAFFMRSKLVTMLLVLGLVVGGGGAGVIAKNGGGGGGGNGGGGNGQYKPGKGCGDQNHTHTGPIGNLTNKDCPSVGGHTLPALPLP